MLTRQLPVISRNLRFLMKSLQRLNKKAGSERAILLSDGTTLEVTRSMSSSGDFGSGAGKGGGSGGSIREAGGSFGKMEAAHEEEYFRKLKAQQLKQLRENEKIEMNFHESQIKAHKEAIKAHEKAIKNMEMRDSDSD